MTMTQTRRIGLADATDLLLRAFRACGLATHAARSVAKALVAAEAEGQVGHGFSRLADYAAQARSGKVNPHATPRSWNLSATQLAVDADHGFLIVNPTRADIAAHRSARRQEARQSRPEG